MEWRGVRLRLYRDASGRGNPEAQSRYGGEDVGDVCHDGDRERPM